MREENSDGFDCVEGGNDLTASSRDEVISFSSCHCIYRLGDRLILEYVVWTHYDNEVDGCETVVQCLGKWWLFYFVACRCGSCCTIRSFDTSGD